jgi:hypothetical protein
VRRATLFVVTALLAHALPPLAEILGDQVAGSLWAGLRLTSPWLSQAGGVIGGAIGGAVFGLALRLIWKLRIWPVIAASVAVSIVYVIYTPAVLLVTPVAAGLAAFAQNRQLRWVRGATFAAALTAMAHLLPVPHWASTALTVCAGIACAVGAP